MNSPKRKEPEADPESSKIAGYIAILAVLFFVFSLPISAYLISRDTDVSVVSHLLQDTAFTSMSFIGVIVVLLYKMVVNLGPHEIVAFSLIVIGIFTALSAKIIGGPNAETFSNVGTFLLGVGSGFYGGFGKAFQTEK
jgi:uncharacterized membrane protein YobD (UPF0266 family)